MKNILVYLCVFIFTLSAQATPYLGLEGGFLTSKGDDLEVDKTGLNVELKAFKNIETSNWSSDVGLGFVYLTADGSDSSRDVNITTTALDLNLDAKYRFTEKLAVGPAFKGLFGTDTTLTETDDDTSFNPFVGVKADYKFSNTSMPLKGEAGVFYSLGNRDTMLFNVGLAIGFPSKQEQKINNLNEFVVPRATPTQVMRVPEEVVPEEIADVKVTLKSARVLFNTNVSSLDSELSHKLERLGKYLTKNSNNWKRVKISGHTDSTGGKEYNQKLSQDRSDSVMNVLIDAGVNPSQISAIGYGFTRPIDPANNPEAYSKNRRTEIEFFGVSDKDKLNKALIQILK